MLKKFWNWLSQKFHAEEKWNPIKWQGTKWISFRRMSTGVYHVQVWYEVCRNKEGCVALFSPSSRDACKTGSPFTTVEKHIKDLLSEEQAAKELRPVASDRYLRSKIQYRSRSRGP